MKPFAGYEPKKQASREPIPAGGYVVKVLNAEEISYTWGNVIEISFDVIEGEKKGFFREDYKNNTNEDRKWRGKYRLNEPKEDGTEQDGWTKNTFNGTMFAFEYSNPGYHWNWDETTLKGLTIGALFRNREWEMNGRTGWTTECCALIPAEDVRSESFKLPKDRPLSKKKEETKTIQQSISFEEIEDGEDDMPF